MIKVKNEDGSETRYSDAQTALAHGITQSVIDSAVAEQAWQAIKQQRDPALVEADHLVNKAEDRGLDSTPFRQYRDKLRDIPQTYSNPEDVVWPQKPALPQSA